MNFVITLIIVIVVLLLILSMFMAQEMMKPAYGNESSSSTVQGKQLINGKGLLQPPINMVYNF